MDNDREIIMIVDDDSTNLIVGKSTLSEKYDVFTASSGEKLFSLLEKISPDLILLDIRMPEMDGYEVIKRLKRSKKTMETPVIFLTSRIDPASEIKGLNLGAVDYITKPFSRELLHKRIDLHILFQRQKMELQKHNLRLECEVDRKTRTVLELQNTVLRTVAELVECRDNVTGGHIERTQHYLRLLIGFTRECEIYADEISTWDVGLLVMSSQLHDVGKIAIKDSILLKPDRLTDEELAEMHKHTTYGVDIITRIEESTSESAFLNYAKILAGSHHERWDGAGYPYGLKGVDIPLQGRLMAIIDVYDALTNGRPYKESFTHEQSVQLIREGLGTQFDPVLCKIFLTNEASFRDMEIDRRVIVDAHGELRSTMSAITNAVGERSGKEKGYVERMRRYLELIVNGMLRHHALRDVVSEWDLELFLLSAQMHDVGNIAVADHILNKTEELSDDEFDDIINHVEFGLLIIRQVKENIEDGSLLHHAEMMVGSHHEKWDGSGYPRGLKGRRIPLQGRIMAIVDVYDALTTARPHRGGKPHSEAVELISKGAGTHFDPELVEIFLDCEKEFEKVATSWPHGGEK